MDYADQFSDFDRFDEPIRTLLQGLVFNRQRWNDDQGPDEAALVTDAIRYHNRPVERPDRDSYLSPNDEGYDPFVDEVLTDVLGFDGLTPFQENCWQTLGAMQRRRSENGDSEAVILAAPTGFGKTEGFAGPIFHDLAFNDGEGVGKVVIAYPRNALLEDQLERFLRIHHHLNTNHDADISIGLYNGQVPAENRNIENRLVQNGHFSLAQWTGGDEPVPLEFDYDWGADTYELSVPGDYPVDESDSRPSFGESELKLSRNASIPRRGGEVPDIMLTTINSLENFGLKANYDIVDEFRTFIFDEVHMYTETYGCHASNIIRNIKSSIRERVETDTGLLFIGSSATVDQPRDLGSQLFGIPQSNVSVIRTGPEDKQPTDDTEHFHFVASAEDVGTSSTFIQQILLFAHALLDQEDGGPRKKALAFIDSVSQVNQRYFQITDFEDETRWSFHDVGDDDWDEVARQTPYRTALPETTTPGHELIRGDLNVERTSSDRRLSADEFGDTDLILSTSLLEVGIDIPAIKVVSQYKAPWEMSQFIQRIGRASRTPGNDAHFLVTLGDDANDRTMFQRAERFLEPEIDTPLNADNEILRWLHNQLLRAFKIAYAVEEVERGLWEPREEFLQRFLEDSDEESLQSLYRFADNPIPSLQRLLERQVSGLDSLWTLDGLDAGYRVLSTTREDQELDSIAGIVDVPKTRYTLQVSNLEALDSDLLEGIDERLSEARDQLDQLDTTNESAGAALSSIQADIDNLRERITSNPQDRRELYDHISDESNRVHQALAELTNDVEESDVDFPYNLGINIASDAAQQARSLRSTDELISRRRIWRRAYHLQRSLQELYCFINQETDDGYIYSHKTVPAIKSLLRAVYFHNRAVTLERDRDELQPPFYYPTSYFGEAGETFSVVSDARDQPGPRMDDVDALYLRRFEQRDDNNEESEVSITKLFYEYAPYMSKYLEDRSLELFNPPVEPAPADDDVDYYFDIQSLQTEPGEDVITPQTLPVRQVEDQSGNRAQSIVRFCTESLYVARSHADQGPHGADTMTYGKLRSNPIISTSFEPESAPDGAMGVAYLDADVRLDGVTLTITPARPMGDPTSGDSTPFKPDYDIEYDEDIAFRQPLGFSLKTRGELWDISDFIETLRGDEDFIDRFEIHNPDAELEEVVHFTAAHFLLGIVSDVSGVNQSQLLYGVDLSGTEVAVFERAEGGQGVVDLFDRVRNDSDHERMLGAINRVATNAQLINGRLWTDTEFVDAARQRNWEDIRNHVRASVPVPTEAVIERVSQVVRSTIDQLRELTEVTDVTEDRAFELRQEAAHAQFVDGNHDPVNLLTSRVEEDIEATEVRNLLVEPDVDGCVENLHLAYSIVGGEQSEVLSYLVLERLHEFITTSGEGEDWGEEMMENEALPGATIDGTNIFHSL